MGKSKHLCSNDLTLSTVVIISAGKSDAKQVGETTNFKGTLRNTTLVAKNELSEPVFRSSSDFLVFSLYQMSHSVTGSLSLHTYFLFGSLNWLAFHMEIYHAKFRKYNFMNWHSFRFTCNWVTENFAKTIYGTSRQLDRLHIHYNLLCSVQGRKWVFKDHIGFTFFHMTVAY